LPVRDEIKASAIKSQGIVANELRLAKLHGGEVQGQVIIVMPDGTVNVLHEAVSSSTKTIKPARQLKKGTVLHVKK
jgi:hypothetical protein